MDMETFRITVQVSDLLEYSTVWKMDTSLPTEVLSSAGWGDAEARMLVVPRARLTALLSRSTVTSYCCIFPHLLKSGKWREKERSQ